MKLTPSQLPSVLEDIARAGLVANILGSPGVGKSDCVFQFGEANNLSVLDYSLSNREPVDIAGYPMLNQATNRMMLAAPEELPLATDSLEPGKAGFLLFLDEANACSRATAAAAYKLILDRKVGINSLHPKTVIIAAGNLKTDKAIVNDLGTAMQSRMVHIILKVSQPDWLEWANRQSLDHRIISFIKFRPGLLHKFDPKTEQLNFPCPRTWHFAAKYTHHKPKLSPVDVTVLSGCIGQGAAIEFNSFCKLYKSLPAIEEIIANPSTFKFEQKPDIHYALQTLLSTNLEKDPAAIIIAIERLPVEFQVMTLREAVARNRANINLPEVSIWINSHSECLF